MRPVLFAVALICLFSACQTTPNAAAPDSGRPAPAPAVPSVNSKPVEGQVGNGGGGVCIGGACLTLTEAGLRIPGPHEEYFNLPPAIAKAVRAVAVRLPLGEYRETLITETIGKGKNFKLVEVVDPAKLEVIRARYADILASVDSSIDPRDVTIFAFASGDRWGNESETTYLLPSFFELDLDQQAKILIHERNVRGSRASNDRDSFRQALELDGYIQDLLANPELILQPQFRLDRWITLVLDLYGSYNGSPAFFGLWLEWYRVNKGIIFESAKVCDPQTNIWCKFLPTKVTENYEVGPAFIRFLDRQGNVSLVWDSAEITPEMIDECRTALGAGNYASVFIPVRMGAVDYTFYRLACLLKDGTIHAEAYVSR